MASSFVEELFGGRRRRSIGELVEAAEAGSLDDAPEYELSISSKRLSHLKAAERELTPWHMGAVGHADRVGTLSQHVRTLRLVTVLLGVLLVGAGICIAWFALELSHTRVVPYVVQVDKQGFVVPIGTAERESLTSPRLVMAALGRWLSAYRTIVGDQRLQDELVAHAFFFVAPKSTAALKMNEGYAKRPAFDGTGRRVAVEISRIAPLQSGSDFVIDWSEEASDEAGEHREKNLYTAVVAVRLSPTEELDHILVNPSGVFIKDFSITKLQ